jgi:multidrug efflux pump subunit AcrA (membrane-fusion protein)
VKRIVRNLILLVLLAAAVVGGYYAYVQYSDTQAAAAAAAALKNVQYATVTRGTLSASVSATGNVVPVNTARLTFRTGGVVQSVNVKVGDAVKAGDVLAKLDTTDLELALATTRRSNISRARLARRPMTSTSLRPIWTSPAPTWPRLRATTTRSPGCPP